MPGTEELEDEVGAEVHGDELEVDVDAAVLLVADG